MLGAQFGIFKQNHIFNDAQFQAKIPCRRESVTPNGLCWNSVGLILSLRTETRAYKQTVIIVQMSPPLSHKRKPQAQNPLATEQGIHGA